MPVVLPPPPPVLAFTHGMHSYITVFSISIMLPIFTIMSHCVSSCSVHAMTAIILLVMRLLVIETVQIGTLFRDDRGYVLMDALLN